MTINLTDPANHPANSQLTGERIERVIEALESSLKYRNGSTLDHFIADAVKGLRELREVRKAKGEPVALEEMTACKAYDLLMEKGGVMSPVDSFVCAWNSCRAAMVHDNRRDLSQPVDLQVAEYEEIMVQAIPDNSFTNEELEAMAHGNNPQANAYRELLAFRRNSPVTPDGWILVPEEPTYEMLEAGDAQFGTYDVYRRMIEAAPKEVG
ncbi:hypothetical protein [Kluyvera ascorbata]|uniref:hypothetical protein n=1 Tax=Kluyvera ascorbata TaxID=51288 RepID=UPI002059E0EF|nr:hypothetical protein [Kluyvera ascorbata]UPQ70555.1 hypothetical protein MY052_17660 [Kluyvera ascorbata]